MTKLWTISFALALGACAGTNGLSPSAPATGLPPPAISRSAAADDLYVVNYGGDTVTVYASSGKKAPRTISQGLNLPVALAFDGSGNLYVANYAGTP